MRNKIITNHTELTNAMKLYDKRYSYKSTPNTKNKSPQLQYLASKGYHVVDFDNGWIHFTVTDTLQLVIHSIYAEKDYENKFKYVYNLAKHLKCKGIVFETERNPKVWMRMIDRVAKKLNNKSKTQIRSYTLNVALD